MNNIVSQLFKYQRDKQDVENNLKNGRIDITQKYDKRDQLPLFVESGDGLEPINNHNLSHTYDETQEQRYFF